MSINIKLTCRCGASMEVSTMISEREANRRAAEFYKEHRACLSLASRLLTGGEHEPVRQPFRRKMDERSVR